MLGRLDHVLSEGGHVSPLGINATPFLYTNVQTPSVNLKAITFILLFLDCLCF